jgi:2-methylisocitrate lyase-like PEP mutase family enzyme
MANRNQQELAAQFHALHESGTFVIPNVWDGGSAAIAAGLGFKALATSSAACAAALGRLDGAITRAQALEHARLIVAVSPCAVAADLENGFGHAPAAVAETIHLAAASGLVGCSIEDASGDARDPIYALEHAVQRIAAAAQAARALPFQFTLTARAENFLHGRADLADTLQRLQAFERAGADVLFAPGLPDLQAVRSICAGLRKPVNFMVGIRGKSFSVAELAAAGVRRVSLSTTLYRAAMAGVAAAVLEVREHGTFDYLESAMPGDRRATFIKAAAQA